MSHYCLVQIAGGASEAAGARAVACSHLRHGLMCNHSMLPTYQLTTLHDLAHTCRPHRRALIPMHPDLKYAGVLPPLDAPHHLRSTE